MGIATLNHTTITALLPTELYNGDKLTLLKGDFHQDFKSIFNCVTQKPIQNNRNTINKTDILIIALNTAKCRAYCVSDQ